MEGGVLENAWRVCLVFAKVLVCGDELYLAAVASRPSLALWLGKSGSLDNDRSGQRLGK